MRTSDLTETVVVKQCDSCGGGLPAQDNYCRWCGVPQKTVTATATNRVDWPEGGMKAAGDEGEKYQTLSGQLIDTLSHRVSAKTTRLRDNRIGNNLVAAIIAIPILLLIILLSPLDAYAAARAAASQLNYH